MTAQSSRPSSAQIIMDATTMASTMVMTVLALVLALAQQEAASVQKAAAEALY